jgi:hypothetical protein
MSVFDSTKTTSTTLPSWFTTAQQNLQTGAQGALTGATGFGDTATAGMATNQLGAGATNPFTTAMGTLQDVASGAANPFLASGAPDTSTALGGLFSAQNAKLDQILPQITAKADAAGIGGGNFGSLRGQTATNTARAGALTTLAEQQNQAMLNAQTQATNAALGVGNVGSQYGTLANATSPLQMSGDLYAQSKYADILNQLGMSMPKSTTETTKGSSYDNAMKTLGVLFGQGGANQSTIDAITKAGGSGLDWLKNITTGAIDTLQNPYTIDTTGQGPSTDSVDTADYGGASGPSIR